MEDKKFQVASTIESVATRADNTLKITVGCQELQPTQAAALFALKGRLGWFLFSEQAISPDDIPKDVIDDFKGKDNPMTSLTRTLYVYWDQCTSRSKPFNEFIREWVEKKKTEIKDFLLK